MFKIMGSGPILRKKLQILGANQMTDYQLISNERNIFQQITIYVLLWHESPFNLDKWKFIDCVYSV